MSTYIEAPELLRFSTGGAKLTDLTTWYSIPAGYTCRGAKECLSRAHKTTGKIKDGKDTVYRCYEASLEAIYKSVRQKNWHNHGLIYPLRNDHDALLELIQNSIDVCAPGTRILRPHVGGDFHWYPYFKAMMSYALNNPDVLVYFYTKSIDYWVDYVGAHGDLPPNVVANASWGGKYDHLIADNHLKSVMLEYVKHPEVEEWYDHDDNIAMIHPVNWRGPRLSNGSPVFYQLLHGTQPAGTYASKALSDLKKAGQGGYNKKNKSKAINVKTFNTYKEQNEKVLLPL